MRKSHPAFPENLVPCKPPAFRPGQQVVIKRYEDGWRWTVVDGRPGLGRVAPRGRRSKTPTWFYTITATRPHDGSVVSQGVWQYRLRPVPQEG